MTTSCKGTLNLIKEASFDIYIFDLKMPKMNGHDLAKRVIELDPLAKIIIYTGYELEEYFNSLIETGVVGFLSKTDSEEQMIKTIRGLLQNDAVIPIHLLQQLRKGNNLFQTMQMKTNLLTGK
ncbi:response regulator [Sporosarcina sp. FSL K6-3457]|uniref:response regulator n=1 Tax=Sporosarcina sp. FSL K6-3457 TaxID=2978204 RepID=UPI0030FBC166